MPDNVIVRDSLAIILEAVSLIEERMEHVGVAPDFVRNKQGRTLADAILLRLQIISQKIDRIQNVAPGLLEHYNINPQRAIPTPHLLELHYDEIDFELLFDFCKNELPLLKKRLETMLTP